MTNINYPKLLSSCRDYSGSGIDRNRMQRSHTEEDENDLLLSEWMPRIDSGNFASCDLDGFSSVDDDILTTENLTAENIVAEIKKNQQTLHLMKRIYKKKKKKILKNKKLKLMCRQ